MKRFLLTLFLLLLPVISVASETDPVELTDSYMNMLIKDKTENVIKVMFAHAEDQNKIHQMATVLASTLQITGAPKRYTRLKVTSLEQLTLVSYLAQCSKIPVFCTFMVYKKQEDREPRVINFSIDTPNFAFKSMYALYLEDIASNASPKAPVKLAERTLHLLIHEGYEASAHFFWDNLVEELHHQISKDDLTKLFETGFEKETPVNYALIFDKTYGDAATWFRYAVFTPQQPLLFDLVAIKADNGWKFISFNFSNDTYKFIGKNKGQ